jgi:hypothetical protein
MGQLRGFHAKEKGFAIIIRELHNHVCQSDFCSALINFDFQSTNALDRDG